MKSRISSRACVGTVNHMAMAMLCIALAGLLSADRAIAQQPAAPAAPPPPTAPQFIMALARDAQGNVWAGCEDQGVWKMDATTSRWQQFTTAAGLGDDNGYALACDRLGRVWVGHLNHGVSVYNGEKWQNYEPVGGMSRPDSLSGPLGERVFAIKVCPTDGDVWIATNAGLTRYSESKKAWLYYNRADGLSSDASRALAFDPRGNLYVGTYCDGVAMARAEDGYKTWKLVRGLDRMPTSFTGSGLPSNFINDILVTPDGMVVAATPTGLGYSNDDGLTWRFSRGRDYSEKVRGMAGGPPPGWAETPNDDLLAEDYVTCLAPETGGGFWVGHRDRGASKTLLLSDGSAKSTGSAGSGFVNAILPLPGEPMIGTLGAGVQYFGTLTPLPKAPAGIAALPPGAPAPTAAEIDQMIADLKTLPAPGPAESPLVLPLADDWRTRGDWIGSYGRYFISLNGTVEASPATYLWGAGAQPIAFKLGVGPNHTANVSYSYWTSTLYTNDPRSLEMTSVYYQSRIEENATEAAAGPRRQSEFVDNGQAYSAYHEGPDLYFSLTIPTGLHYLSLYSVNDNGHTARNRFRDNSISIRSSPNPQALQNIAGFDNQPELARGRFVEFWAGVYKRFLVQGPTNLAIRIGRDYSLNAKLSAVALDAIDALPDPYYTPQMTTPAAAGDSADRLADALEKLIRTDPRSTTVAGIEVKHVQLARWYVQKMLQPTDRAGAIRAITSLYRARYFEGMESLQQKVGMKSARTIEKSLKWDGVTNYSGRGRQTIQKAVSLDAAPAPVP